MQTDHLSPQPWFLDDIVCRNIVAEGNLLVVYDNPHIRFKGTPTLLFGHFRGNASQRAVAGLMEKADQLARLLDKTCLLGPMDGSTWMSYRLPLEGCGAQFLGDVDADSDWIDPLLYCGFSFADYYQSTIAPMPEISLRSVEGITIRSITPQTLSADLRLLYPLCEAAFAQNEFFSPLGEASFIRQYESFAPLLYAGLSRIALIDDEAVAFILAYPDLTDSRRCVIKTAARHPQRRIPGLVRALESATYAAARASGCSQVIHALMHEDNPSLQRSQAEGSTILRQYALFVKQL